MAKKPKDEQITPEDPEIEGGEPEATEITEITPEPVKPDWPEKTEKRQLRVELEPLEIQTLARSSAELGEEIISLEEDKKASAESYKAQISAKIARRRANDTSIRNGWEERGVACRWEFQCCGVDAESGEQIYHPDKKALIREDNGAVVEVKDITDEERQQALPLEEEQSEPEMDEDQTPADEDES